MSKEETSVFKHQRNKSISEPHIEKPGKSGKQKNDRDKNNNSKKDHDGQHKSSAQHRWLLLARALTRSKRERQVNNKKSDSEEEENNEETLNATQRLFTFGLLNMVRNDDEMDSKPSVWYTYSTTLDEVTYQVQVRWINQTTFTANELIGFNNTGNICVWPSEECLAYYLLKNRCLCTNRRVLELGGGMSCLAGVFAAKYCNPTSVTVTDGNASSIENVRQIVAKNCMSSGINCSVLQWSAAAEHLKRRSKVKQGSDCPPHFINSPCRAHGIQFA